MAARLVKALLLVPLVGCSLPGGVEQPTVIEVVSTIDETVATLKETPTTFIVPYKTEKRAFERMNFFLKNYVKGAPLYKNNTVEAKTEGDYTFSITRGDSQNGMQYQVECQAPSFGSSETAELNAQNLSRFILSGEIELTLIK